MNRLLLILSVFLPVSALAAWGPMDLIGKDLLAKNIYLPAPGMGGWISQEIRTLSLQAGNIDHNILKAGLSAYLKARQLGLSQKELLTIIDYSKPSSEKRLWVFDLKRNRLLFNTWVTHGKNSGGITPTSFSNLHGSHKSSLGVFVTKNTYVGKNGYSLRMQGLEPGINDQAESRDIVIHGAAYATAETVKKYGQTGHSWGCPAISSAIAKPLIDAIRGHTLIMAWYPDRKWLTGSRWIA